MNLQQVGNQPFDHLRKKNYQLSILRSTEGKVAIDCFDWNDCPITPINNERLILDIPTPGSLQELIELGEKWGADTVQFMDEPRHFYFRSLKAI